MKNNFYQFVDQQVEKAIPATWKKIPPEKLPGKGNFKIKHAFHSSPLYGQSRLINLLVLPLSLEINEGSEGQLIELRDYIQSKDATLVVISEEERSGALGDTGIFIDERLRINSAGFLWIVCGRDQQYRTRIDSDAFEDLNTVIHDLWKGMLYYDGPSAGLQQVNLELMQDECWKCHIPMTTVTGLVFPNTQLQRWDSPDWLYYNTLLPLSELDGENARSIEQFVHLLRKVDTDITPVKYRHSRARADSYFMANCPHCKAKRGDFYVDDDRTQYLHSLESRITGQLKYFSISLNIDQESIDSLMDGYEGCDHTCICGWRRRETA